MSKLLFFEPRTDAKAEKEADALLRSVADSEAFGPYDDELSALLAECLGGEGVELSDDMLEQLNAAGLPEGAFNPPKTPLGNKHEKELHEKF